VSRREVIDCDRCGKPGDPYVMTFGVTTGRGVDAAGSPEDRYENVDLCQGCMGVELTGFLQRLGHAEAKAWVERQHERRRQLT
jgi:hypothetical protein